MAEHPKCETVIATAEKAKGLEKSDAEQWKAINTLQTLTTNLMTKFIPAWVALLMTAMGGLTGGALTLVGVMIKMTGK